MQELSTPKPKPVRYPELDLMKGIAMVLVVVGHVIIHSTEYGRTLLLNILAAVHVPAFIFVSGFLASRPIKSWRTFWSGKIMQLLVPMLLVGVLYTMAYSKDFMELFTGVYHNGYWFTFVLFILFVLYALFRVGYSALEQGRYDIQLKLRGRGALSVTELLLALVLHLFVLAVDYLLQGQAVIYSTLSWSQVVWLMPYLLLGHFVARSQSLGSLYRNKYVVAIAFVVVVATLALDWNGYPILRGIPKTFACVCVLYNVCLSFADRDTRLSRAIKAVGSDSLGIYLWHTFFLFPFPMKDYITALAGGGSFVWELIFTSLAGAVVVALTYAWVQVLKFNPIIKKLLLGAK